MIRFVDKIIKKLLKSAWNSLEMLNAVKLTGILRIDFGS